MDSSARADTWTQMYTELQPCQLLRQASHKPPSSAGETWDLGVLSQSRSLATASTASARPRLPAPHEGQAIGPAQGFSPLTYPEGPESLSLLGNTGPQRIITC